MSGEGELSSVSPLLSPSLNRFRTESIKQSIKNVLKHSRATSTKIPVYLLSRIALRPLPSPLPLVATVRPCGATPASMAALFLTGGVGLSTFAMLLFPLRCRAPEPRNAALQTGQLFPVRHQVTRHDEPMLCLQGKRILHSIVPVVGFSVSYSSRQMIHFSPFSNGTWFPGLLSSWLRKA